MYLITAKKFGDTDRGAHTTSTRFAAEFPNDVEYIETSKATNLEELNDRYKRLIFRTQVPRCYATSVNIVRLLRLNHLIYVRKAYAFPMLNTCTNGFYYYKYSEANIKNYIPIITDFPKVKQPDKICIGFYARKWLVPDAFKWFIKKLDEWPEVDVFAMGIYEKEIEQKTKGRFRHTYNNIHFFNNITHYVMPKSVSYVDPFPHTLLEAVQSGKQIIIPTIGHRNHKDGIDDIQDCIQWHDDFYPDKFLDNSHCLLTFNNFKRFYQDVIQNNFEYSFDKRKYNNMAEWILEEII